jgi:lysophospholipase L1-like esterase
MKRRFVALLLCAVAATLARGADSKNGPTPFPDSKDEAAWPGKGPVRVFGWMVDNRNYFWTQREKDQGAVVFAGDSLTGNWKIELMHQLFPGLKIANRGIGGDVSRGLLFRFKEDVLDLHPRAIVILIGANDLSSHANTADAESNISAIIDMARQQDFNVPIVLCQTAPRDSAEAPTKPGAEADMNSRIAKLGADKKNLVVLNLFSVLGDANGRPIPELFAKDKLHLAGPGYVKWAELIRPAFRQLGIEVADPAPGSIKLDTPKAESKPAAAPTAGGASKNFELRTTQDGIAIDAGSLGSFTLGYPQLIDDSQKALHKLTEKSASGKTATIKYADGGQVLVTIAGASVKLKFVNMPGDVKKYLMDMLIDPSFSKGGSWKIGDKSGMFPREKPASPHLYQGNANTFRFAGASGQAVSLKIPDYAYEELNDNREWNWTIFGWKFIANLDAANPEATIVITGEEPAGAPKAAELKATEKGIAINAGSIGSFELEYPVLRNAEQKPVHKKIEAKASGKTATVKYEDGAQLDVSIEGSDLAMKFSNVPGDVKSYESVMMIDIGFSKGGKWKIGDTAGEFPAEKPAKAHLFQGNQTAFELVNLQGQSLSVRVPDYAYQQLTDNREWGWSIFAWRFTAPFNPDNPNGKVTFTTGGSAAKKLVDAFGQSTADDYPGKVKNLDELKADVEAEKTYFDSLHPPERDRFGGFIGNLALNKTGFFHVQMDDDGRQWLVDPDGNAFFHIAPCCFNPGDDYTYIKGRENIYEWLPDSGGTFKSAFREGGSEDFSFHLANMIKKYGKAYWYDDYAERMIGRVRKWGFNSIGAFSSIPDTVVKAHNFPYVLSLPLSQWEGLPRVPGVFESFDPFDESTRAKIEENFAKHIPARANDPLLIGYFVVNEPRFDEIPKNVPALNGRHACKRKLVSMLGEKYKKIEAYNTAWEAQAKSFDELNDAGLAMKTDAAKKDMEEYTGLYLDAYFSVVNESFRKHDANHMLIGARYQPQTINNEQLCRITGKYCDVMSFNYYTLGVDKTLLKNVYEWSGHRPMMLSEFFWSSPRDSGLAGGRDVKSQKERGLAYRNYVEQSASLGFVIGIEWFTLVDQAVTGRWFSKYNGESANTGLIAVSDRPWKEALAEMLKTNYEIYDVLLRKRPPFAWDDARVK